MKEQASAKSSAKPDSAKADPAKATHAFAATAPGRAGSIHAIAIVRMP